MTARKRIGGDLWSLLAPSGLDVSVKETSVCRIVREVKVASEPEALLAVLKNLAFKRIGLEAGPLSQ